MKLNRSLFLALRAPVLGILFSLAACTIFLLCVGENPSVLFQALGNTLFTDFGLGYALFYTTPLIFTGLAVAVSFQCGLFNIGGEGQLYVGSIAIIVLGSLFPNLPSPIAIPLAFLTCAIAGGFWGGLAGWLKAKRGSHEVIVTILLNFIGIAMVNYLLLYRYRNPADPNPETAPVPESYWIAQLQDLLKPLGVFNTTPVNVALFLAIAAAVACYFLLYRTTWGFELRAVGQNPTASRFGGISVEKNTVFALALSGALAGCVGINEIQGYQHRLIQGFSPQYGFTGIAVSLLARNHPLGILLTAFLFGTLSNSTRELEFLSEKVTKELSLVLQATLIAFVSADFLFAKHRRRKSRG